MLFVVYDFTSTYYGIIRHICFGVLGVFAFFACWVILANFVKRLHDFNCSGWFCLLPMIVVILAVCSMFFPDTLIFWGILFKAGGSIVNSLFLTVLCVMPGSKSENNYGLPE